MGKLLDKGPPDWPALLWLAAWAALGLMFGRLVLAPYLCDRLPAAIPWGPWR